MAGTPRLFARLLAAAAAFTTFAACSLDVASQLVDETHPVQPNIPTGPAAPAPAAPPLLTPCAPGWREVPGPIPGDAVTCDPWPAGGAQDCAADSAHFPGTTGCSRIGTACPAGDWPEGLPAGVPVLYVRAGGPAGGAGTQASPFGSITAALAAAAAGTILALAKGTFDEAVVLPRGITLWGACVSQSHLAPSTVGTALATILVLGDAVAVRNLHVGGVLPAVVLTRAGTAVELKDLVISGAHDVGLVAGGAVTVTGSRVVIRGTLPRVGVNDLGEGLLVNGGAQVDLSWVAVEACRTTAVDVYGAGTRVRLSDSVVRGTLSQLNTGAFGEGLFVHKQGRIEGVRIAIERNTLAAVSAENGGQLSLTDAVLSDTAIGDPTLDSGFGALITSGGVVDLHRVLILRPLAAGVLLVDDGSALDVTDLVVRDTLGQTGRPGAFGIQVSGVAGFKALRLGLERTRGIGLAAGKGAVIGLEDVTARDTEALPSDAGFGSGFSADLGSKWTVTRARVEDTQCIGIQIKGAGTSVDFFDATVRGTRACSGGIGGQGLAIFTAATASMTRALFENNRSTAIVATGMGTRLELNDLSVIDTQVEQVAGAHGEGLAAQYGGSVELSRARFERSHEVGFVAAIGGRITGTNVVVRDTLPSECLPPTCRDKAGIGALSMDDGSVTLSLFSIAHSAVLGLLLARGGTADLQSGEISENPIGLNVQTAGFDLARVERDVIFRSNQVTVSAMLLPLPDALAPTR